MKSIHFIKATADCIVLRHTFVMWLHTSILFFFKIWNNCIFEKDALRVLLFVFKPKHWCSLLLKQMDSNVFILSWTEQTFIQQFTVYLKLLLPSKLHVNMSRRCEHNVLFVWSFKSQMLWFLCQAKISNTLDSPLTKNVKRQHGNVFLGEKGRDYNKSYAENLCIMYN